MQFFDSIEDLSNSLKTSNVAILCDENTHKHCFVPLNLSIPVITVPAGEESKSIEQCEFIWEQLIALEAGRGFTLYCLGGGVVTDLGGFAASCYMRGISFVHIPTSLLGMVDASIGGKCGVDFMTFKNYLGAFSEPMQCLVYPRFLETLPESELSNGLVEMLKHGLIANIEHYEQVKSLMLGPNKLPSLELIQASMKLKIDHVSMDFREHGLRKRLNFGHTIGHAIESACLKAGKAIAHGEAVALGIIGESYISFSLDFLSKGELNQITEDLSTYRMELIGHDIVADELINYMMKDKKNVNDQVMFTLLRKIGSAQENLPVPLNVMQDSIHYLCAE